MCLPNGGRGSEGTLGRGGSCGLLPCFSACAAPGRAAPPLPAPWDERCCFLLAGGGGSKRGRRKKRKMPGKLKVKIVAGRHLPVMDRASDLTDAFVEVGGQGEPCGGVGLASRARRRRADTCPVCARCDVSARPLPRPERPLRPSPALGRGRGQRGQLLQTAALR